MKASLLAWTLLTVTVASPVAAAPPGVDQALVWLLDQRTTDGGWSASGSLALRDTAEALRAIESAGWGDGRAAADARAWLGAGVARTADDAARRTLALAGTPFVSPQDVSLLLGLLQRGEIAEHQHAWVSAVALRALAAADRSALLTRSDWPWLVAEVAYAHRGCLDWNDQGCDQLAGWGLVADERGHAEPDVVSTALSLAALADPVFDRSLLDLPSIRQQAAAWLISTFNPDGGAGRGASTVHETCLALLAMEAAGALDQCLFASAVAWLRAQQLADGSFGEDPFQTALAVQVLMRAQANLNLEPESIVVAPAAPVTGEPAVVSITVSNQGRAVAAACEVSLYLGNPGDTGTLVDSAALPPLTAGEQSAVELAWTPPAPAGSYELWAVADAAGQVAESDESDNRAARMVRTLAPRDVAVAADTLELTPAHPAPGAAVTARIRVDNTGGADLVDVHLRWFDGDPAAGGVPIGADVVIPSLPSMESRLVESSLGVLADGLHTIHALADPDDVVIEGDESDNGASIAVRVAPRIDLVAMMEGIELSDDEPEDGDTLLLRARVWNTRELDAQRVLVRLFEGDPRAGGVRLGSDMVLSSIGAQGSAVTDWVSYETLGRAGNHDFYAQVDPLDEVEEISEDNNLAARTVMVARRQDLALTAIAFSPNPVEEGTRVRITVTLENLGSWLSDRWLLHWIDGDPAAGGQEFWYDDGTGYRGLDPGGSKLYSAYLDTASRPRDRPVTIELIPADPNEISTTNNRLVAQVPTIDSRPDLAIASEDIVFAPDEPIDGDSVTASVLVRNLRDASCPAAPIELFYGTRTAHVFIAAGTIPALGPYGSATVSLDLDSSGLAGDQVFGFVVDRNRTLDEVENSGNNWAEAPLRVSLPPEAAPIALTATPAGADTVDLTWTAGSGAAFFGLLGYLVYRDGHLVTTRRDRTADGQVSASSMDGAHPPQQAVDRQRSSYWKPEMPAELPEWLRLDFAEPTPIGEVAVWWWGPAPAAYGFEVLAGGAWLPVVTTCRAGDYYGHVIACRLENPDAFDGIRLVIDELPASWDEFGVYEFGVYEPWPLIETSASDGPLAPGRYTYWVEGMDAAGARTLRSNEAEVALGDVAPPAAPVDLVVDNDLAAVTLAWSPNAEPDLAGYGVYRSRSNVTSQGHGCLDFKNGATFVGEANDGDRSTATGVRWSSGSPEHLSFELPRVTLVDRLRLFVDHSIGASYGFRLEGSLDGKHWSSLVERVDEQVVGDQDETFPATEARWIRFAPVFNSTSHYVRVAELEMYSPDLQRVHAGSADRLRSYLEQDRFADNVRIEEFDERLPRRFRIRNFDTHEDDVLVITDADNGLELARYSGDLGDFTTPLLIAARYRFRIRADYEITGTSAGLIEAVGTEPPHPDTSYSDQVLENGQVRYAVTAIDRWGNESHPAAPDPLDLQDTQPPAPPTGLDAAIAAGAIDLSWQPNQEADLAGYKLYRDDAPGVPLNGPDPLQPTGFTDEDVVDQQSYTYRVTAVDINGNESAPSDPASVTASRVDLVVGHTHSLPSVSVFPRNPSALDDARVAILVANEGDIEAGPVEVAVWDGIPEGGGSVIGSAVTGGPIPPAGSAAVVVPWPIGADQVGAHDLVVVVDPADQVQELDEDNNRATVGVNVAAVPPLLVQMAQIDVAGFPQLATTLRVADANGHGVFGLREEHFQFIEDGAAIGDHEIEQVSDPDGSMPRIDLVFMVDTWCGCRSTIMPYICQTTSEMALLLQLAGADVNLAVYAQPWGTYKPPPGTGCVEVMSSVVYEGELVPTQSVAWAPAVTWAALYYPWRNDATRVAIPVTGYGNVWDGAIQEAVSAANANDVTVFALATEEPAVIQEMMELAAGTGGGFYLFGEALAAVPEIFDLLASEEAQYRASMTSPRPERDGSQRTVTVTVAKAGVSGGDSGAYQAPYDPSPDLTFAHGGLSLTPDPPAAGQTVTAEATVINVGDGAEPARGVRVRLFDGDPAAGGAQVGADAVLGDLASGQTAAAAIEFTAAAGAYRLFMVVDPDDAVDESVETNNAVAVDLEVPGADRPEFTVAPVDIGYTPDPAITGEPVELAVVAHNRGTAAAPVLVGFYAGDPLAGGELIGQAEIAQLAAGASQGVTASWVVTETAGSVELYAFLDPLDAVAERDEGDNLAAVPMVVRARQVDVAVTTDRADYPMNTDVIAEVRVVNETASAWTGTGRVTVEDAAGTRVADLGTFEERALEPVGLASWASRLPAAMAPAAGQRTNATLEAQVDFTAAMAEAGAAGAALDPASVRVLELDAQGTILGERPSRFDAAYGFDAVAHAVGTVRWVAEGVSPAGVERHFQIYFDTAAAAPKPEPTRLLAGTGRDVAVIGYRDTGYVAADLAGGFSGAVEVAPGQPGSYSAGVAAADFDGDGLSDVIEGRDGGQLVLAINNGDGSFAPPVQVATLAPASTGRFDELAAADFDGDGDMDVVASTHDSAEQFMLRGDGLGGFAVEPIQPVPGSFARGKAACDVNGDGLMDLVMGYNGRGQWFYAGRGDGSFADPVDMGDNSQVVSLACADFDADGQVDLVLAPTYNSSNPPRILFGEGDGTIRESRVLGPELLRTYRLDAGDFDLDGRVDLLCVNQAEDAVYLFRNGGSFVFSLAGTVWTNYNPLAVAVGPYRPTGAVSLAAASPTPRASHALTWNTGLTPAGGYEVRVRLSEGAGTVAEDGAPFSIVPSWDLGTAVHVDQQSYGANESVAIAAAVELGAGNAPLAGAEASLAVLDSTANEVWSSSRALADMLPLQRMDWAAVFEPSEQSPGTYQVRLEVELAGSVLDTAQTSFELRSCADDESCLTASVATAPEPVAPGGTLVVDYWVNNAGNADLVGLAGRLAIVDPMQAVVFAEEALTVDLAAGQALSGSAEFVLGGLADGPYLAILQADYGFGWVSVGHSDFSVLTTDADGDGYPADVDCDDGDPTIHPGALEICDGVDNDCDGETDEELGSTTCGLGACTHTVANCAGGVEQSCDPYEGATEEICDGVDNDCDGETDEVDADGDGYSACIDDCDDTDPAVNPGQAEVPFNGKDDDCDPATPDEPAAELPEFVQAVCVSEAAVMRNNALIASYDPYSLELSEQGEVATGNDLTLRNNATVAGDAYVYGDLLLRNNALITGDAHVGGSLTLKNNAWIDGEVYGYTGPPPDCSGNYDLAAELAYAAVHNDNARLWADPDIEPYLTPDGGLVVGNNGDIVLPGGSYHLAYLEAHNNARLRVRPGAAVVLFIEGSLVLHNNAALVNGPAHPEHLYVLSGADGAAGGVVQMRNNVELGLYLYAPYAHIQWNNNAAVRGGVVCTSLVLRNNTEVLQPAVQLPQAGR